LHRNMLVYAAAAENRLVELRAAARSHLAWCSIVEDSLSLDLTAHQASQARTKQSDTSQQVDALIAETFTQVLIPTQKPGTSEVEWQTVRASTDGDIGARVSRKLASSEELIARLGGVRVRMNLDRYDLWSDRGDISVRELWQTYTRYPYMARLSSFDALTEAVSDGAANMNWTQETFAYAEDHDGEKWVGVHKAQHVAASPGGLLIYPDFVPTPGPPAEEDEPSAAGEAGDAGEPGGDVPTPPAEPGPETPGATQFYAQFDLDPVRGIKQLGQILDHVSARLGSDLELSLELRANKADGYDDATQRIVSENATNLGAKASEFE
ncbi:MAG: collagen-like protein, partial [bacterium]|nr:collagen-like protein [bacterium]